MTPPGHASRFGSCRSRQPGQSLDAPCAGPSGSRAIGRLGHNHGRGSVMGRGMLGAVTALAGLALAASGAAAATGKCPHVSVNFVFGQEANVNRLDQMTSTTISTRNIAMNMFESLMTRDENFSPILD